MTPKHHIEPLLSENQIHSKIAELATQISLDYHGRELILIGILHGGASAVTDLGRALWRAGLKEVKKDYIGISSYNALTESSGETLMTTKLKRSIKGSHVLIVDDIVDTGRSLTAAIKSVEVGEPQSIATFAILSKPSRREVEVKIDYLGFEIPNKFVVGYDLDYDEKYRTMPDIGVVVFD